MSDTVKGAIIGAIITGIFGLAGSIFVAGMAKDQGEQETLNQLNSQIASQTTRSSFHPKTLALRMEKRLFLSTLHFVFKSNISDNNAHKMMGVIFVDVLAY